MKEFRTSLHPGQMAIHNSQARFKACAAGRRFGKTHLAALELTLACLEPVNRYGYTLSQEAGVYYVAPTFDLAKRVMWPKLKELCGYERTGGLIRNENINDGWLELISGRRIYIKGADKPDSLRGLGLSFVVLDEYADMKADVWEEIIEPALMDYEGSALFIGTPKGKNHFYKLFMDALKYEWDPLVDKYPMWEAFHFKSEDNPFLKRHELKRMLNKASSSRDVVRQELEAAFVSGGGKILRSKDFIIVPRLPDNFQSRTYVTVDPAGFNVQKGKKVVRTDECAIGTTSVEDESGDWYIRDIQHGHWDAREVGLRIMQAVKGSGGCRLGVESGALSNAIAPYMDDYMREFDRYITIEPLKHGGVNKIQRIEWALQGRSQRKKIFLLAGDWNQWFLDQVDDFPDPLAHDDGLDAIAYVDQMSNLIFARQEDIDEWEALDIDSGY